MCGNSRGSDVDGHAECLLVKSGPQGDDLRASVHGHGDLPLLFPQHFLQQRQQRQIATEPGEAPFELERVEQPPQVAGRILHVRLLHLHVVQAYHRIQLDVAVVGFLAHHLPVHLAVRRHVDHHIALYFCRARESAAGLQLLSARIPHFGVADRRDAVRAGADTVLRKLALGDQNLAASTKSPPAAYRIDVHTERTRRLQQRRAHRKASALAGRGKYNECAAFGHGSPIRLRAGTRPRGGPCPPGRRPPAEALRGIA